MNRSATVADRSSSLIAFFALSLFAWVIWLAQTGQQLGILSWAPSLQSPLNALTVWSPGLAAMFLTWRASGKPGLAALFRSLGQWRVPLRWYAIALLLAPATWVLAFSIDRLLGLSYDLGPALLVDTFTAATAFMIPIAILFTLPDALGEELGWRAFALPRLQTMYGPLVGSVVLGLFWGFWHIPARVAWRSSDLSWWPLLGLVINTVPTAILFTWIFNRTGGNLLLVCLYHASITNKGYFMPKLSTLTETVLLWLVAIIVVVAGDLSIPRESRPNESSAG